MAKGTINPAFQGAPFLGESSHDPIEFQRRHKMIRYQQEKQRQEEIQDRTAKGLEKLMLDLKSWEDKEGFNEIVTDHDKIIKGFLELSKRGLNLTSPKTSQEIIAYKAIQDAQQKVMQKVDVWGRNKDTYDLVTAAIKQDQLKPEDQRNLNPDLTTENLMATMKGKSILDRDMKIDQILAFNVKPADVIKKITDNKEFYIPPTKKQTVAANPETGQNEYFTKEDMTPEDTKENVRRAGIQYEGLTKQYKETIKKMRESDPDPTFNVMTDKDYFATIAVPTYKKQFLERVAGKGGGFDITFLGQKGSIQPGTLRPEPLPYGSKVLTNSYIFPATTKSYPIPLGRGQSEKFRNGEWRQISEGTVEGKLYAYNRELDGFIFNVTKSLKSPFIETGTPIFVPREVLGDQADELRVIIDGKVKTLKEAFEFETPVTKEDTSVYDIFTKKPAPKGSELPDYLKRK